MLRHCTRHGMPFPSYFIPPSWPACRAPNPNRTHSLAKSLYEHPNPLLSTNKKCSTAVSRWKAKSLTKTISCARKAPVHALPFPLPRRWPGIETVLHPGEPIMKNVTFFRFLRSIFFAALWVFIFLFAFF